MMNSTHFQKPMTAPGRRRALLVSVALAACLGATGALAGCSAFPYSNQIVTAQVKAIDGQSVTLQAGSLQTAAPTPPTETVTFARLGAEAFTVGDTSVYSVDEATRAAATIDPAIFDATFPISFDGEAIAYDSLYVTNEVVDGVTVLTISAGGSYELIGTLPSGRIVIDTPDPVRLGLKNVNIVNEKGSVIEQNQPGTLVITPAAGTSNTLTTHAPEVDGEGVAAIAGLGAVIVQPDSAGDGALFVESSSGNGIEALTTRAYDADVTADTRASDAATTVDTRASDAAAAADTRASESSSSSDPSASDAAATSDTSASDAAATISASASDAAANAAPGAGVVSVEGATLGISAGNHGLYSERFLSVTGGRLDITATEDALASDGDARIAGGDLAVDAGDDAVHGDFTLVFEGGALRSGHCKEGLEAERLFLRDGSAMITSSDDGLNAAAPEAYDDKTPDGYREADTCVIAIGNGVWRIDASGDGIDSNGSLQMNGGTVLVSAPENGDNTALDYDGRAVLVGGIGVFTGNAGMNQGFSEADQPYVNASASGGADSAVTLATVDGAVIVSWAPPKGYGLVTITAPGLATETDYHLVIGGEIAPVEAVGTSGATAGFATSGTVSGGTTVPVQATTEAVASQPGGPGAPGATGASGAPGAQRGEQPDGDGAPGTARMYGAPEGDQGQQPKGGPTDNGTPPAPPDDNAAAPTPPDGEIPNDQAPTDQDFTPNDAAEFTVTLTEDQLANLTVGAVVEITFGNGSTVTSLTVLTP